MKFLPPTMASGLALTTTLTFANTAVAFDRDHSAHVHGHATLTVVVEKNELVMNFTSPAANIVGFEHQPSTHEQEEAIDDAVSTLKSAGKLFSFDSAAGCSLEHAKVESALIGEGHHKHEDKHDHGHKPHKKKGHHHDGHDDHHKGHDHHDDGHHDGHHGHHKKHDNHGHHDGHKKHDDHGHHKGHKKHDDHHDGHDGHHPGNHEQETHSEFAVEYHFECETISKLSYFDVKLFEKFPSLEEIEAQIVGPKGQSLQELDAKSIRVSL